MVAPGLIVHRCCRAGVLTFLGLLLGLSLQAQTILPADGTDPIKKEHGNNRSTQLSLFAGEIAIRDDDQKERFNKVIDCEARWIMYRFTWRSEYHNDPGQIDGLFKDFERDLYQLKKKDSNEAQYVLEEFAKKLAVYGKEVLLTNQPIARLNAARVLEKTATAGAAQNELADLFVEILAPHKNADGSVVQEPNDGVRFYALRGLRNLLALPRAKDPVLTRGREEKAIQCMLDLFDRKVVYAPGAPREEVEGYRSLRREAIRALAWSRFPSLTGTGGRPGLFLLRAAVRDGFVPETRFDEQVEAMVGVCRLQPTLDPSYRKDYAIYILGSFIADMGSDYQRDKDKRNKRPYRYYAARLLDALELMKVETKNKAVEKYTREAIAACAKVLSRIEQDGAADPLNLVNWLEKNRPDAQQLYEGRGDSTVTPAKRRDEAAEPPVTG